VQPLTLRNIRALYEKYVPLASRHPGARNGLALWWPAHEIGHLLTVPRRNIGMPLFGLDNEGTSYQETERFQTYELAAMSISRRLLTACGRPDLFYDPEIGELENSDYDVVHYGSRSRAKRLLRQRRLLRLPRTRSGLEVLCQGALAGTSPSRPTTRRYPKNHPNR
jgi:hypothetical protein